MNKAKELKNQIDKLSDLISDELLKVADLKKRRRSLELELLEELTGFKCGQIVLVDGQKGVLAFTDSTIRWHFRPFKKDGTPSRRSNYIWHSEKIKAID